MSDLDDVLGKYPLPLRMVLDGDALRITAPCLGLDVTGESPVAAQAAATAFVEALTPEWASGLDEKTSELALDAIREVWTWTAPVVRVALAVAAWRVTNKWPVRSDHWVTMRDRAEGDDRSAVVSVHAGAFAEGLVT